MSVCQHMLTFFLLKSEIITVFMKKIVLAQLSLEADMFNNIKL